ncbi:MAG TPA: hypothetical protein DIT13_10965 [Verrucomicrobiales bacterium]|nr:hypothetical protein [Verrucomicrobiales bacterium]HRJ07231.1 hypothetical protein [Prosthecobacter sp.]HRK14800.1 hypothetical protein [Prosthecobacter sp.]
MTQEQLDLLHGYLNGTLDEAGFARLQALLRENPDARRTLRTFSTVDSKLYQLAAINPETVRLLAEPAGVSKISTRWLSWRPLTAAAAGLVLGLFSATCVFAYSRLSPFSAAEVMAPAVTLLDEGFEAGDERFQTGFPVETGVWGGDEVQVVGERDGITPVAGQRMLRVEPDEASNNSNLDRILDLSGLPMPADGGTRHVEVTAWFHADEPGLRSRYMLRAAVFAESAGDLRGQWVNVPWQEMESQAVALAKRGVSTTPDMEGWQKLTIRVEAPPEARSLVVSLSTRLVRMPDRRAAQYMDEVTAALWLLPPPKKTKRNLLP